MAHRPAFVSAGILGPGPGVAAAQRLFFRTLLAGHDFRQPRPAFPRGEHRRRGTPEHQVDLRGVAAGCEETAFVERSERPVSLRCGSIRFEGRESDRPGDG